MQYMKALQVVEARTFKLVQIPIPTLSSRQPDSILIRPEWVSLCGSDIPFFTGAKRHRTYPLSPGAPIHECSGWVVKSNTPLFRKGDRVVSIPEGDLGLAEFFVAKASKTVKLPENLDDKGTSCLIQPLSTVLNAVDRLGSVTEKSVCVVGLGSIGLFFCWLLKRLGAARVLGVDPSKERGSIACELGADQTFSKRSIEHLQTIRQGLPDWEAPDICIEAVGHQMDTLNDCLELVSKRGTVLAFGVPDHPVYAIEYETFFRKNAHLLAVVTPDWSDFLVRARDLFLENRTLFDRLVTHRLPIQEAAKAFTLYERHEDGVIKLLLDTSHW
jgi:L-iditol 2-dehydrogenase